MSNAIPIETRSEDSGTKTAASTRSMSAITDHAVRFSIVIVLVWIGSMKFTSYEAGAIEGLVASSPLMAWLYSIGSQQGVSNLIGIIEIATAIALVIGVRSRRATIVGSVAAMITFAVTLTFLLSAPGWEGSLGGFPALSVVPGQFLLKDVVLLAASASLFAKAVESDSAG